MAETKVTTTTRPVRTWEQTYGASMRQDLGERDVKPLNVSISADELEVLLAKAQVCDRYMAWLVSSNRYERDLLQASLDRARRLDPRFRPRSGNLDG